MKKQTSKIVLYSNKDYLLKKSAQILALLPQKCIEELDNAEMVKPLKCLICNQIPDTEDLYKVGYGYICYSCSGDILD